MTYYSKINKRSAAIARVLRADQQSRSDSLLNLTAGYYSQINHAAGIPLFTNKSIESDPIDPPMSYTSVHNLSIA